MPSDLRTFIAVDISQECINYISSLQSQLKQSNPNIKWVKPDHCHITLRFLGKTPTTILPSIIESINQALQSIHTFSVQTSAVGAFPSLNHPEIFWLGINDPQGNLGLISTIIENNLSTLGFPKENRPFTAHITFARTRSAINLQPFIHTINRIELHTTPITVDHITFYQSLLTSQGPEYHSIYQWSLKKASCI